MPDPSRDDVDPRPVALVLSGGGARGAYEVGVARYILADLLRETGVRARFDYFAGTSVGALNACALAGLADRPEASVLALEAYWRNLTLDRVIGFGLREMRTFGEGLFGARIPWPGRPRRAAPEGTAHTPIQGLFDTEVLRNDIGPRILWDRIPALLRDGHLKGLTVCATELCRGRSVFFYEMPEGEVLDPGPDPAKSARAVRFNVDHAMASAAIPVLFPSVQIDGYCYTDGGMRHNTPLHPARRMGARRILVVSLFPSPMEYQRKARFGCRLNPRPGIPFLLGRVVTALMQGAMDHDLYRMRKEHPQVETFLVRPSEDLNDLAQQAMRDAPDEMKLPGLAGQAFHRVVRSHALMESDLASYIMFTPTYLNRLVDLGWKDAAARRDELVAFFGE
jgi:NTE family protein